MLLDQLNLNQIRVFECVYRLKSMSDASVELHLTQSGVSQHIKSLEERLGKRLFDRVRKGLLPTAEGKAFYESCARGLELLEAGLREAQGQDREMTGSVSIGMPAEFGNNIVLPGIARFCRANPKVKVRVQLGIAPSIHEQLRSGALDFAFVDDFRMGRGIRSQKVFDEELVLCASQEYFRRTRAPGKGAGPSELRKYFESLEYIDYLEEEPVLRSWFEHHLGKGALELNIRTTVMEVQSVARLIEEGLGAGILPGHRLEQLQSAGKKLHVFKGSNTPLRNSISLATLEGRTHSSTARAMMESLFAELKTR